MGLLQLQAPAAEPVTLAEAKLQCRVDGTDEDALINSLIATARLQAEHRTGRALITQTWRLTLDRFPFDSLELPLAPAVSVEVVTYLDETGTRQTLSAAGYQLITDELVPRLIPAYGEAWPSCRVTPGSVRVDFTAGYGTSGDSVPKTVKQWMLLAINTWYAQRENVITVTIVGELPRDFFDGLLDLVRIVRIA